MLLLLYKTSYYYLNSMLFFHNHGCFFLSAIIVDVNGSRGYFPFQCKAESNLWFSGYYFPFQCKVECSWWFSDYHHSVESWMFSPRCRFVGLAQTIGHRIQFIEAATCSWLQIENSEHWRLLCGVPNLFLTLQIGSKEGLYIISWLLPCNCMAKITVRWCLYFVPHPDHTRFIEFER